MTASSADRPGRTLTTAEAIDFYGHKGALSTPGGPPCAHCGTWPKDYWLVTGYSADLTTASTFGGHQTSEAAARALLARLKTEHPELVTWEITRAQPAVIVTVVALEDSTSGV